MSLLLRTALVWLLVLALPAQGIAAATMAYCGPGHHGGVAAAAAEPTAPEAHAHHHASVQADVGLAAGNVPSEDTSGVPASGKCSACAACCSIGAIPSAPLTVPALSLAPTVFSSVVVGVEPFAASGPDRPPRIDLA